METGYYIDSGWAINNNEIETPNNKTIWNIAGYDSVPTISELVKELSISVYTKTILEGH